MRTIKKGIDTFPRRNMSYHKTQKFAFSFRWFTDLWRRERGQRMKLGGGGERERGISTFEEEAKWERD